MCCKPFWIRALVWGPFPDPPEEETEEEVV